MEKKNKGSRTKMMNISLIKKKIDKVFLELENKKVKCDFLCCQTCGTNAMWDYEEDLNYEGYCFYHNQDLYGLKIEGITHLAFGSFRNITQEEIGDRIFKAFKKEGIKVTWNGKVETRIMIDFNGDK